MATWANLLGYQAAWFATVWGAGRGMPWLGVLACTLFVAWQLGASHRRGDDARVLLAALACGLVIEAGMSLAGLLQHAATPPAWPAPAWIVALWGAFGLTLNHSMAWFARRRWIAAAFAGVGAPLAYLGAARGFGAVAFATPVLHGVLMLGLAWAIALPLLLRMNAWQQLLLVWALAAVAQALAWARQQRTRNAGIVDVVWSFGVGSAAVVVAATGEGALLPRLLLGALGGLWGLRLGLHLLHRVRGEAEDGRYAQLRKRWGDAPLKWFGMFQFQALLIALFSLPFLAVAGNPVADWNAWFVAGIAMWIACVAGEAIADRQLARFRADPANTGKACRAGLWRYSRHPNYFFEWLHWFAYVLLAVGSPLAWLAWSGPLVMYLFLRFLSGVPFTEAQALRTRGEDYARYQRSTPMLIPWFPKEER